MNILARIKTPVRILRAYIFRGVGRLASCKPICYPKTVLIVAPHPDDETFGVGGLIASMGIKAEATGSSSQVHVLFLTSGGRSHAECCDIPIRDLEARREAVALRATHILGVEQGNIYFFRLDDGGLPQPGTSGFSEVVDRIASLLLKLKPDSVFVPHPLEGWSDHEAAEHLVRNAIVALAEPRYGQSANGHRKATLYHYCVWFWFSMPLKKMWMVKWRQAITIELKGPVSDSPMTGTSRTPHQTKLAAMNAYLEDSCPCGRPSCGVLPGELLRALEWERELIFRVDR